MKVDHYENQRRTEYPERGDKRMNGKLVKVSANELEKVAGGKERD